MPLNARIKDQIRFISEDSWQPCLDKEQGEVAEFGYRMASSKVFRRYIVKRIERNPASSSSWRPAATTYWVCVTNDHHADPTTLES